MRSIRDLEAGGSSLNGKLGGAKVVVVRLLQGEASFTQRLFLRPGCQGNEFVAEFLQCIINTLLNEKTILMDFFCDLKFLLIN